MTTVTSILFAASLSLGQTGANLESELEVALGTVGLTNRTARFDENLLRLFRQGEFTSPLYDTCSESPWRTPFVADALRREFAVQSGRPNDALNTGGRLLGFGTRRTLIGDPIAGESAEAKKPGALGRVLTRMKNDKQIVGPLPALDGVPAEVQSAAALILGVLPRALELRRTALQRLGDLGSVYRLVTEADRAESQGGAFDPLLRAYRGIDLKYLAAGAHDLFLAAQAASSQIETVPESAKYDFSVQTIWGWIRLTGGTPTRHPDRPTLVIIDTGGNDVYLGAPATASASNWASVVLDSAGQDKYLSAEALESTPVEKFSGRKSNSLRPGPGGAVLGFAALIDSEGNDLYRSHLPSFGSGRLGFGLLLDRQGSDEYDAYRDSEGFGMFGAGILEDVAGDDRYQGFNQVQGVGQTQGLGLLIDRAGKDEYIANDSTIDFASPQSAEHNVSMSQGAGNGRRADYLDGHSLAGGVGILFDAGGDDTYRCGVFGQGVGYWEGVGMLWDGGGVDSYTGQWYVQGASAHFAIGYLEDEAGNDRYTAPMNMAQGAGHDYSLGVLLDRSGDDVYSAPNLSLGAGNANGIGWFVDLMGNDRYQSAGVTLGRAAEAPKGSLRARALCLGVFMDMAGEDTYPGSANWASNGARTPNWTDKGPTSAESQVGVFWDR